MSDEHTTAVVQRYLNELDGDSPAEPIVRANQHMRWELNDLARRLDDQPAEAELCEALVPAPARSVSGQSASQ
jgi:RNA polymerase sigma-70 factor (ECF subfamily)